MTVWKGDGELGNYSARFQRKVVGDEVGGQELGQEEETMGEIKKAGTHANHIVS